MKKLDIIIKASEKGLRIPDQNREVFNQIIKYCNEKRGGFMRLVLSPPFKHRSTGEGSQGNHINSHCRQIAMETGEDFDVVKGEAKRRAISRGYPIRSDIFGFVRTLSETEIDTIEASYLIDSIHQLADEFDIKLNEDEVNDER